MKFLKKNNVILLSLLVLLNIVLRLPMSHAFGADTYFIYSLANSISEYGYARWVIHPLSLVGTYPLSYASMYPFLLSGISTSTNVSIEYSIWVSEIILSIFAILSIYCVAKEIENDDFFAFIVAFVYSLSPVFFFYTNWMGSERGIFMSLFPFFIYIMIKSNSNIRYFIMSFLFLILLATVHRLFYFIPLIVIGYISAIIITKYSHVVTFNLENPYLHRFLLVFISVLVLFCIQSGDITENYLEGASTQTVEQSDMAFIPLINLFVNFIGKIGLNLLFVFVGIIHILTSKNLTLNKTFLIMSFIFLTLTLPYRYYTALIYTTFLSLLIGFGIIAPLSRIRLNHKYLKYINHRYFRYICINMILISSILFTIYMDDHWKEISTNSAMKDETYETGLFVHEKINATMITNSGWDGQQINAISGKPVLPFGIQQWFSPLQLVYGFEDRKNLEDSKLLPLKDLLPPPDVWYTFENVSNVKNDYQSVMYNDISSTDAQQNLLKYNIGYVILNKDFDNKFVSYGIRNSQFIPSMIEKENKILDTNSKSIWCLNEKR